MGEQLSDGIKTRLETAIDTRDNKSNTHTNSSTTDTSETKRGRGRPRKNTGSTQEENGLSGLASVKNDEPMLVSVALPGEDQPKEQPKKKAGRPKGKTTSSKARTVDSTQIQLLLVTLSAVVASRPGMEIWNISADEAKQIADPLANIMAKNEALGQAMGEHADAFALVTACFVVFLPKLLMHIATKPKKPKQGATLNYGTERTTQPKQPERENRPAHISDARPSTSRPKNAHQNFGGQLSSIISPVGGL